MSLWHFHSRVLDGFYASDVYVSAISPAWAVQQAGHAFDRWVKQHVDSYGFIPLIDDGFNDQGLADQQLAAKKEQFLEEARSQMRFIGAATILRS